MRNKLYREKAIERLSTPERLDTLMQPTTTRGWLALAGAGLVLVALLAWGILGRVADSVPGSGIILREGGVFGIQVPASGMIQRTLVSEGDEVVPGQVVARIAQPELEDALKEARSQEARLQQVRARTSALVEEGTRLQVEGIEQQRLQAAARLKAARANVAYLETRAQQDQEALDRGLITPGDRHDSEQRLEAARDAVAGALAQAEELQARIPGTRNESIQTLLAFDDRIRETQARIRTLEEELRIQGSATSPYHARVVEILADEGEAVSAGTQVMLLEMWDRPVRAVVFVSEAGRRVVPGMAVRMSPAGLQPEEFGYMLGKVTDVSEFPSTPANMNRYLRNPALVEALGSQGNTYMVSVALTPDRANRSGFRWTSRRGPSLRVGSGTLLTATVAVRTYPPISLVFPTVRRWLGMS